MDYYLWLALTMLTFLSGFMLGRRKLRKASKPTPLQLAFFRQRMKDIPAEISNAYLTGFEMGVAAQLATNGSRPTH